MFPIKSRGSNLVNLNFIIGFDNFLDILFITAETYSKFIHPKDKSNKTIFGDAAAATLISSEDGFAEIGNFDYVDTIASKIIKLVKKNTNGLYNVGSETKTMFELASKTNKVEPIKAPMHVPHNTSMDISKMQTFFDENSEKPFFSIAIPAYGYDGKGVEFLDYNFEKLSNQIFKDFEVVVSDHSIDDTIKTICNK